MSYIASFDIGTTSIKGILFHKSGTMIGQTSHELTTIYGSKGKIEQKPLDWWNGILTITNYWWTECSISASEIEMITFSGQMQNVIMLPPEGQPTANAILYSDNRAGSEAQWLNEQLHHITEITGNHIDGASPFAKILWLKENDPEAYSNSRSFVFSAKDFVVYKLTNAVITDPVTGATTGMMDIERRNWHEDWLATTGIPKDKLPVICSPEKVVGEISSIASQLTGFREGTPVLSGCGDAGATTMGAGAVQEGDAYIYMGTTGWIAVPSNTVKKQQYGVFNLAHLPDNLYISIAPLLNVGNVHRWGVQTLTENEDGDSFNQFESLANASPAGAEGLLFLPYLHPQSP